MIPADIAALRALQTYLKENVEELNEVFDQWPNFNDEMDLPCCSIIEAGTPLFTNFMSYELKREADPDNALNDLVYTVIGQYDFTLQLDVWAEYKIQRSEIHELIDDALNKQHFEEDAPNGLSLSMSDYHDVIARYDKIGYTNMDSPENSQRTEWRTKIDLLVSHVKVTVRSLPRMSEITLKTNISEEENDDDYEVTIIN